MCALRGSDMRYGHLIPKIYPTGVFIQSIEQTKTSTEAGGKNIVTITLTNHTQQRFEILNGPNSIKEITASIDNGIGTPSVTVTATGAGAEKIVHFDFKNLKGEAGNIALTEEVKQHISQAVVSANKYTDDLLIKIFQNGYIQWPGMPSPLEDTSLHFEGYSWYEVNYDGKFFRAKGLNAKTFSAKKLTVDHIKNGAYIFQDDEQGDTIRDISGVFGSDSRQPNIFSETSVGRSGCFEATKEPTRGGSPSGKTASGNGDSGKWLNIKFKASRAVPTSNENRPRNLTFTIWVLVKDE